MVSSINSTLRLKVLVTTLIVLFAFSFFKSWGQTSLVLDDFGAAAQNPISRTGWTANAASGSNWELRTTGGSTGYSWTNPAVSASGSANVFTNLGSNTNTKQLTYDNSISTVGYTGISVRFGGLKSGTVPNINVLYSTDGTTYISAGTVALTTSWAAYTVGLPVGAEGVTNLRIRFEVVANNSTGNFFRIDDFHIIGTLSCSTPATPSVPVPAVNPACTSTSLGTLTPAGSETWYWQGTNATGTSTIQSTATSYAVSSSGTYYVRALNAAGTCWSTLSAGVTVTVNTSPSITSQPVNRTICEGSNTTFVVAASGSPLTYQWQYSSDAGATFTNVPASAPHSNVTAATMNLTAPSTAFNSYVYRCIVSVAGCSSVTSNTVLLTVVSVPVAPPVPTPVANPACSSTTLAAMTSTVGGVVWYWETSSGGTSTTSVTTSAYNVTSSGNYYARAQSTVGACWSTASSVSVTINTPVTLTGQPSDRNICTGTNTSFTTSGSGVAPKFWQYSSDGGSTFTVVPGDAVHSGTNSATLNLATPSIALNSYVYQMIVNVSGCPAVTSNTALLTVIQTPAAPPTPTASANPACSNTSLTAMSSTVAGVTWYWQGTNSTGTSTTNPTSASYNVSASGTYYVRARADGSSCLSISSSTAITIIQPPTVTSQPTDKTQCTGTNTTFLVSATGTGLSYQWQVNTGSGFGNLVNGAPYSNVTTATMSITNITGGMNGYQYQCVVSGTSPCSAATSSFATLFITGSGAPTTAASSPVTSNIGCNGFNISWTNGDGSNRLVVVSAAPIAGNPVDGTNYTANTNFTSGGTIAVGEYVVYKGTSNAVTITGLSATTIYYYKIFEYNGCAFNYLTSGTVPNGNATTGSCTSCSGLTGAFINACDGSCSEGDNEILFLNSGSYAIPVSPANIVVKYESVSPPTVIYTSSFTQNAASINNLNTLAGCPGLFVDASATGVIPANTAFMITRSTSCFNFDFSSYCGSGPIYVLFSSDADWATGGNFVNGDVAGDLRYFRTDFSALQPGCITNYNYEPFLLVGSDGASVSFPITGGAADAYFNSGCTPPAVILPIELLDFYGTQNGAKNDLIWKVAVEDNIREYVIEKSSDGINFEELTRVNPQGTSLGYAGYLAEDLFPNNGITYYRLSTVESEGELRRYKIIDLDRSNKDWQPLVYQMNNDLVVEFKNSIPKNSTISLYDLSGKQLADEAVKQSQTKIGISDYATGLYFVKIASPYKTENFKIVLQK